MTDQSSSTDENNNNEYMISEEQRKNNPDNNQIRDVQVIEKKIRKLIEIHQDWHSDSNCTCCQKTCNNNTNDNNTAESKITTDNLHLASEDVKKTYNTDKGLYWDWLSMDDIGKKCFFYKNDPFNRDEYSNIGKFFEQLELNYDLIRSELDELLKQEQDDFQAWPETICKTKGKWKVYPLGYAFGRDLTSEPTKCPKTVELLSRLNREYNVHITTSGFSCLSSNCYISAHKGYCGYSNHCLRVHMGLIVPNSNHHACAIRVGNVRHCWNERAVFGFDDYITHEAYNFTDQDRYILLLDIRFREAEKFKFYDKTATQNVYKFMSNASLGAKLLHANMMTLNNEQQQSTLSNDTPLQTTTTATASNGSDSTNSGEATSTPSTNDDPVDKWKGIEKNQTLSNSTAPKTFVTLSKYVTNDIECLNANYSDELKYMLKNVVDKN